MTIDRGRAIEQGLLWLLPDEEAQANIKDGLERHQRDNKHIKRLQACDKNSPEHILPSISPHVFGDLPHHIGK
ncbi:hypothetical protein KSC_068900 [Ktedonobacter sp. SOSP1-52]|nr:hypothetical protein KSC_068900 [Ktedonobacter sp. SOSP1-52]